MDKLGFFQPKRTLELDSMQQFWLKSLIKGYILVQNNREKVQILTTILFSLFDIYFIISINNHNNESFTTNIDL